MAVIERIESSEARPYVVAWGRLTEEDEDRLRTRVAAPADTDVTVDLCEVEEVTDEGCVAIKDVAEDMGCRGRCDSLRENAAWGYFQRVAEHQATEQTVAASDSAKGALRDRRWSASAGLVTALLLVSLVFSLVLATPAIAGRLNKIDGTANADRIRGTSASDRIRGEEGNDILRGWAGDDRLVGGPDDDVLVGGPGRDSYVCGGGEDVVVVDFSRLAEHFGNGCEVAVFDV